MEILQNVFRTLMFFLDNIVYGLIPTIYKLFVYLANLNLYGNDSGNPIQEIVNHIYVLLGIFMLFKVSFSLLQYIVDPSSFRDSSKGMGKLVTNVLVAMVLLVSVPFIFEKAMELQAVIVENNVIGQLIFGQDMGGSSDNTVDVINTKAKDLQFLMFGAFYSLNPEVTNNETFAGCAGTSGVFGSIDMATESCLNALDKALGGYEEASANNVTLYSFFKHGSDGLDERKFGDFDKLLWWKVDGQYVINYLPFISTVVGIYVVFLLITFCADIALRAIKLLFLQMIAPIAIVSYIDPKESISNGKMSAWIKETASTYFSLFIRLATVFLVVMLVSVIASSVLADGGYISGMINPQEYDIWIYLFLIIGAFMFARQVPKIIESIFGIKGSGNLSLNPFKTVSNFLATPIVAAGGAAVGGALGAAAANTIAAAANTIAAGSAALPGAISGFTNSAANLRNNWGHNISDFRTNVKNSVNNFRSLSGKEKLGAVVNGAKSFGVSAGKAVTSTGKAVSPWLGVGTGAISGAVRGARAGYTDKNMLSGANKARLGTNDARLRRDVYGTEYQDPKTGQMKKAYSSIERMQDAVRNFAGIRNKDGGIGKIDKQIKDLSKSISDKSMEESGLREQMSKFKGKFDEDQLKAALHSDTYEEYLRSQSVRTINEDINRRVPEVSASSSNTTSSSTTTINPTVVASSNSDVNREVTNVNNVPLYAQNNAQNTQSFTLPAGMLDKESFEEYKRYNAAINSVNEEQHKLEDDVSLYQKVSDIKHNAKKQ